MNFTIAQAVWLVGVHSIIHGIVGIFIVTTSFYVNYNPSTINSFVAANVIFVVMGFCIFCVVVWRNPLLCKICGVLVAIIALSYFVIGIMYFVEYVWFFANSVFDAYIFYTPEDCWAGPEKHIVIWHVLVALLLIAIPLWFVYAYLLFKLAKEICCVPCPPCPRQTCGQPKRRRFEQYVDEVSCVGGHIRRRERWYQKITPLRHFPSCPPPPCPPPPCPPPPSCPQQRQKNCPPPPCPPPCKRPTFTLHLKPTKLSTSC